MIDWKVLKAKAHKEWVDFSEFSVLFYKFRLLIRRKLGDFHPNFRTENPKGFRQDFADYFDGGILNKWNWGVGQTWGKVHPSYPHQYSDESCINVNENKLILTNLYRPKQGTQWVGQPKEFDYDADYAHGEIESHRKFLYGIFEIRCAVPREDNVITAFWLSAEKSREIDIFEFFPKDDHKNSKGQLITIHWDSGFDLPFPKDRYMTPKEYRLPLSITTQMNTYTMIWTPKKLEFKFNGEVIRRLTNKKVLATLNRPMGLIVGNGLDKNPGRGIKDLPLSPFVIDYIKHWAMD